MSNFKSKSPCFCRYCGKGLKKVLTTINLHLTAPRDHIMEEVKELRDGTWVVTGTKRREMYVSPYVLGTPTSIAECRKLTNQQVVSVKYRKIWDAEKYKHVNTGVVASFNVWDGESYHDEFFCTDLHARFFGYVCARGGQAMKPYNDAMIKANEKAKKVA